MSIDQSALSLGRDEAFTGFEQKPPLHIRIPTNLYRFTRRKPLGAFGGFLVLLLLVMAVTGGGLSAIVNRDMPSIAPYHYNEYKLGQDRLKGPSSEHWFGTDEFGRDVFSRLLYGAGVSVTIGVGVFALSTTLSTFLTMISGYYVTSVDLILQRFIEIFGVLPDLIILISLMAIYGASPLTFVLTLGILNGINTSRVLRSVIIGLRGMPYIEAAKAIGATDKRILRHYILPNVFYLIIVGATGGISGAIQAEAGLAIIGVGLNPNFPTWGTMLNASRELLRVAPWLAIFPALMLAMTIFGFRLLGDALRDVLDPRLRGSR
ncbi:MAG TPA: ABC transporter permease [Dehalococcoidia bacterium]|nr:ABC transporter permease [Dehalococcoidia bacterium]